jgi:hypothetical protein
MIDPIPHFSPDLFGFGARISHSPVVTNLSSVWKGIVTRYRFGYHGLMSVFPRIFTRVALIAFAAFYALQSFGDGFEIRSLTRNNSDLSLFFDATQGDTYRLERKLELTDTNWEFISGLNDFTALNTGVAQITDAGAFDLTQAFYRLVRTSPCDAGLASNSNSPLDYARAMELCEITTELGTTPGVISARLTLASGSGTPAIVSRAIRPAFGASALNSPRGGMNMVVLSTGAAAATGQTNPAFQAFQPGLNTNTSSTAPADWLILNGGVFPVAPGCPAAASSMANNSVMLTFRIRVPGNANSFRLSAKFFSAEYPEWVCSPYNDLFIALLDSNYVGDNPNPADKNLAVYSVGESRFPMGANLVGAGLFTQCLNGATGCAPGAVPGTNTSGLATSGLTGTGMEDLDPDTGCGTNNSVGGGTDWLIIRGNVIPGEIITLRFAIWDTADALVDSVVLLDNFAWSVDTIQPGMTTQ